MIFQEFEKKIVKITKMQLPGESVQFKMAPMERLAELTGTISMPPLWALGYQQCRYSYMNTVEMKSIIDNFRERKLP